MNIPGVVEYQIEQPKIQLTQTPTWSEESVKLGQMRQARSTIDDALAIYRNQLKTATDKVAELSERIRKAKQLSELKPEFTAGCSLKVAELEAEKAGIERSIPGLQTWLGQWEAKDRAWDRSEYARLIALDTLIREVGPLPQPVKPREFNGYTIARY